MQRKLAVTIWNENRHEKADARVAAVYPNGIHGALADFLSRDPGLDVKTSTLDEPEQGLSETLLGSTEVLVWWSHLSHGEVRDEIAARVQQRVLDGMGLVALHSAYLSKPFLRLMGTSCKPRWGKGGGRERLWVVEPGHPIAEGLGPCFDIPHEDVYAEPFDIPAPDCLVLLSWFETGDVLRSGCCFNRGRGRIFFFRPGHETFPTFHQAEVQRVIKNAVRWTAPTMGEV